MKTQATMELEAMELKDLQEKYINWKYLKGQWNEYYRKITERGYYVGRMEITGSEREALEMSPWEWCREWNDEAGNEAWCYE
jgi:hypothetical protein